MTEARTEAEALAQVLTVSVGGEPVALRTLTIDESDAWLRRLTGAVDVELPETEGDADTLARMLALPATAALDLVATYDADGVLGDPDSLRGRMTKRELHDALEAMADAEDPFGEGAARLADEVFGAPSRFLATMTSLVIDGLSSPTAPSPSGASTPGASTGSSDIRSRWSRERFLVCWTYGHERERAEAAERREAIADGVREGYAEVHVDAGLWSGRPRRWWRDTETPAERKGLSGRALVDWVSAMAAKYPENVRLS